VPLYYRDPSGAPRWSAAPKKDSEGRDYLPVYDEGDSSTEPPKARRPQADSSHKILYYRNPMGLPDTSPVPKKDPMGMDYVPVYEGEHSEDLSIKLSPGKIQRTGAKSEPVVRQPIKSLVRAPGTVQEDERRVSVVALRFEGFVESVANVTTGDHVQKGQPLMNVYSPALSSAAAEYLSALNAGATGKELKGARRRLENLATPEPAIRDLERTREIALSIPWLAPQDGEILQRNATNGMRAGPGDVLFRIADHRVVWVVIDVAERDLAQVVVGSQVNLALCLAGASLGQSLSSIRTLTCKRARPASALRRPTRMKRCGQRCAWMPRSKRDRKIRCWLCRKAHCSIAVLVQLS
jgi:Cu(I)/Ag(I) efflux system membrane fusion protein